LFEKAEQLWALPFIPTNYFFIYVLESKVKVTQAKTLLHIPVLLVSLLLMYG
jgi:hypothetical protein